MSLPREVAAREPADLGHKHGTKGDLGRHGADLLGDDRVLLIVGTAEERIAAINVRPEMGDAVRACKRVR